MFEAIIFDFDGVILDSEYIHYEAYSCAYEKIGLSVSYTEYSSETFTGLSDKGMFEQLLLTKGYSFSTDEINELYQMKVERFAEIITKADHFPIVKDVDHYISKVSQDVKKLAICSGSSRQEIVLALSTFKNSYLLPFFNTIVAADDVSHAKPSPEGYLLAAKRLGVSSELCLAIENSPCGVEAAKNAGMRVIALLTTHGRERFQKADKICNGFMDLLEDYQYPPLL